MSQSKAMIPGTVGCNVWRGAWAHDNYSVAITTLFPGTVEKATDNRFGWMVGAGFEYALNNNWSVKVEYDYLDFGRRRECEIN
jgi:opacity protein-like surface antigen